MSGIFQAQPCFSAVERVCESIGPAMGEGRAIADRANLAAWWERVSSRPSWRQVARSGPQPYDAEASAQAIARLHRR